MIDFRLLGALDVTLDGVRLPVRAPKQRALLVTLLMRANDEVPMDELYWRLWDQRPPAVPAAALHVHVARLRAAIGDRSGTTERPGWPRVRSLGGGYLLQTPPETVDLFRFRSAAQEALRARQLGDTNSELTHIRAALEEWRDGPPGGTAIASLAAVPSLATEAGPALIEERLRLLERRFELEAYPPGELVPRLRALVALHPTRERPWALLVSALRRAGDRQAAMAAYEEAAATLRTRLGLAPGPELAAEYRRIAGDHWHARTDVPAPAAHRTLHGDGWAAVIDALTSRHDGTALPLVCLAGPAGAERTTDLVALARQLREEFPDGQWYVRLTDPDGRPRDPGRLLARLLRLSGATPDAIPAGRRHLVNAYRARLTDRRVLLLLDDARDAEQVRDLLPGSSRCAVVTVGDDVRPELVALHGARSIDPDDSDGAGPCRRRRRRRNSLLTVAGQPVEPPPAEHRDHPPGQASAMRRSGRGAPTRRR
ncbi:BTAD domain-containing putative transcriptional regulator [Micromonospora sp. NPDC049114]|uniref:AfsR/SARP family transcriptional regulator n=1 Tax=unclassified Micromonospora TaxID=2617518 RepID=UPI0033FC4069